MKNLTILLSFLVMASYLPAQTTSGSLENPPPTQFIESVINLNREHGECHFLILADNLPWGSNAVATILTANGETFSTANSATFPGLDFDDYDVIIVLSDQVPAFHTVFAANFPKFVDFVENGGRLQAHAATCGWNSPCGYSVLLPGGVFTVEQYDNYNNIAMPAHPIVAGVSDPFWGSYASHGYFSNLVPGTDIITVAQSNGNPTTIQYSWGMGTVTATTCTYEFGWSNGQEAGDMLVNNMDYSCTGFVPPPMVPIENWALYLGIILMFTFIVIRFRRIF
jgi:hypothetical protein